VLPSSGENWFHLKKEAVCFWNGVGCCSEYFYDNWKSYCKCCW